MPPCSPFRDTVDCRMCHAIFARYLAHTHQAFGQHGLDLSYLLVCQFGAAMFFTVRTPAFLLHVSYVVRHRSHEQVLRIHACPNIAFVAHHQARRNLAAKKLPRQPMRWIHSSRKASHAISAAYHHSAPQPASPVRLGTNFGQKSFPWSKFHWNPPKGRDLNDRYRGLDTILAFTRV